MRSGRVNPERYCPVCHQDVPCKIGLELGHYHYSWVKLNIYLQCVGCATELESDSVCLDYAESLRVRLLNDT